MKDNIGRKGLVLGVIILFVGAGVIPSTVSVVEKKTAFTNSISPGYIQGLIDNASSGDTIYIPSGTYYENIIVNKTINLVGEDKNTTIIDGSGIGDVVTVTADWVNVSGFTIQNSGESDGVGICLCSDNSTIVSNIIIQNPNGGIGFHWVGDFNRDDTIINNIITNNGVGIGLGDCINISVISNTISNNKIGVGVSFASYNKIANNIISDNSQFGIFLDSLADYNLIDNNFISNNYLYIDAIQSGTVGNIIVNNTFINTGIFIWHSAYYKNTIFSNNTVNGKPLVYLFGESDKEIDVDAGQIILINCNNITIQNQELCNTSVGILLGETDNCLILNSTFSSNNLFQNNYLKGCGIYDNGGGNTISGNTISNNEIGIFTDYSNNIMGNTISDNNDGIFLGGSNNNITGNTISNNDYGIELESSSSNTITGNNITSNNNYSIKLEYSSNNNITSNTISRNDAGVYLLHSSSNIIKDNNISNNEAGIYLDYSNNNTIINNQINCNNYEGLSLWFSSSNNTITRNNIAWNNGEGIDLNESSNNTISKNNLINNKKQAFFEKCKNEWKQNYWNRPRILPKLIFGKIKIGSIELPWINIDWRPALRPYDIEV